MAIESGISWTKSTFNPWIGCTKISPACYSCYAEISTPARAMKVVWGAGQPRHRTGESNWNQLRKWDKLAPASEFAGRKGFWPVFCASLADVFDNEVSDEWRTDLFREIEATPNLSYLLVTKRIANAQKMVPESWLSHGWPSHVRLLITVANQQELDRDIWKLLALDVANGISYEPALGPLDLECVHFHDDHFVDVLRGGYWTDGSLYGRSRLPSEPRGHFVNHSDLKRRLEWVIAGGESGHDARPAHPDWFRKLRDQCAQTSVPFFFKQWGAWAPINALASETNRADWSIIDHEGEILDEPFYRLPDEISNEVAMVQLGKKSSGDLLDGIEHKAWPL